MTESMERGQCKETMEIAGKRRATNLLFFETVDYMTDKMKWPIEVNDPNPSHVGSMEFRLTNQYEDRLRECIGAGLSVEPDSRGVINF